MKRLFTFALVGALPLVASAQLFTEDFDTDSTGEWQFNSSVAGDLPGDNLENEANFFFDYSTVGIPLAPNSAPGGSFGLKMEANVFGSTATNAIKTMSASPLGQSFTGNYTLTFDAWQNFQGPFPGGGNGTTQALLGTVGAVTTTTQNPGGTINGAGFAATNDGGSTTDYRAYRGTTNLAPATGAYAAGTTTAAVNPPNPYPAGGYYEFLKGTVPTAQTTYANGLGFTDQTGSTNVGVIGMAWHTWEITRTVNTTGPGSTVTWTVDGRLFATISDATIGGDNISLGYFDTTLAPSTQAISRQLLFGLVDNVKVTAAPVPEPGTMAALGLGALALLRRRRRS